MSLFVHVLLPDNRLEIVKHLNLCDRINLQRVCEHLWKEDTTARLPIGQWYSPWFKKTLSRTREWRALLTCFVRSNLHLAGPPTSRQARTGTRVCSIWLQYEKAPGSYLHVLLRYTRNVIEAERFYGTLSKKGDGQPYISTVPEEETITAFQPPLRCPVHVLLKFYAGILEDTTIHVRDFRVTHWDYRSAQERIGELIDNDSFSVVWQHYKI